MSEQQRTGLLYGLVAVAYAIAFWVLREQSHTGDWRNWIRLIDLGLWYRLREPLCLIVYQLPLFALRPLGVGAQGILAGSSCVFGAVSMAYALAGLRQLTPLRHLQAIGMLALTASYGVSGIFFGHIEHYSIMSLGCFIYIYYALRYLRGSSGLVAPSLALGLLLTTHLMAAWLVASLVLLPWLRRRAEAERAQSASPDRHAVEQSVQREILRALTVAGIPNLVAWIAIIALYYEGSPLALLQDAATGAYSMSHYGVGNALGGGNQKGFLDLAEVFALGHLKGILALSVLYSPLLLVGFAACLAHRPCDRLRGLMGSDGMFFLSALVPYLVYGLGWEPGLGYVNDWDLFSHATIFGLGVLFVAGTAAPPSRVFGGVLLSGLLVSAVLTTYVVLESRRSDTPPGVHAVITSMGVSAERISKRRSAAVERPKRPPNILIYVIDTLRADALSPYGNEIIETPAIQKFANDAVVFERAYASSSWTRPSMASLLTGLEPQSHGVEERGDLLGEHVTLLAERFAAAGYTTGCIIANPNIGPYFGFNRGYDSFIELYDTKRDRERAASGRVPAGEFIIRSDVVTQRAIKWIESAQAPFFLLVLSVDPHTPYDPPEGFDRFAEGAARDVDRATLEINREGITAPERERARSLYFGEISFNDASFGGLLDNLRATGRYDDTIIVFSADHGEEFWEHGTRGHGRNLFEETIRVPLIIRTPDSRARGVRSAEPVRLVDLYPTLLALASLPLIESVDNPIDGRTIAALVAGANPNDEPRPIHTRLHLEDRHWRSVIVHPWKLVVNDTSGAHMLFNLERDPGETLDQARERPKQLERLTALLTGRDTSNAAGHNVAYPDDLPESAREALRALGYLDDVNEPAAREHEAEE